MLGVEWQPPANTGATLVQTCNVDWRLYCRDTTCRQGRDRARQLLHTVTPGDQPFISYLSSCRESPPSCQLPPGGACQPGSC